ncbi:MAG: pimeloyl-ACP methyl ester carboxylesterase [Acidimicrobiales bacterium]|jgi:pimeloyl-ACP methyl ester carboxylesterase
MSIEASNVDVSEQGSGPSVVFTHGWTDNRTSWTGVIDELAVDNHCVSWSLRAHGESEVTAPGSYSREHGLADMMAVTDRADAPYVLVGHSLGGYLSLAHTLLHPERVRALVLVGAGPGFTKQEAMDQWNAMVDKSAAKIGVPEGAEVLSKHFDSFVMDNLATITVPTLVVIGEGDKQFMASAGVFEKRLDVQNKAIVPDAGHSVHRQQPAAVAAAIRPFLASL